MRYTIDFSHFKLGLKMQAMIAGAFKEMLKQSIPECDHPVYTMTPTLIIVEFDVNPKFGPEHYSRQLWAARKAYGLAGIDYKFEVVGEAKN
jgi:hypothetical protein